MALLPSYRSAFGAQTARNTYGAPSYNLPQIAAQPAAGGIPFAGTVGSGSSATPFALPSTVSGSGPAPGPTWAAAVQPAAVQPAAARGPSLTVGQAANRQVNQILAPQLAAGRVNAKQQNAAIQQFALALMGKLQPIAGQVGADWNQAIGQTGALSNQAATFLQQANPTPQVQALLQSIGAPAEQQGQLAGQLGQTFGGGAAVLNFLGGAVPGAEMATDKAAAQSQAAGYPALAALRGQQDLASALSQQATARATIEGTRGQLYATARQNILQNNAARQTAAATAAYRGATLRQGQQKITQAGQIAGAKLTQAQKVAAAKATQAQVNEIDKTTNQKVTALIAEGFDPATGQLTPKTQAAIERIQASAEAAKGRLVEQHRHNVVEENKPKIISSATQGIVQVNPDGTTTQLRRPSTAPEKPFHFTYRGGAWVYDPATKTTTQVRAPAPGASGSGAKLSTAASGRYGYQVDTGGNPILRNGNRVPYPKTQSSSAGGLTPNEAIGKTAAINTMAENMYNGFKDKNGKQHPAVTSRDVAIQEATAAGYMSSPAVAKTMMGVINSLWPAGKPSVTVRSKGPLGVSATATP